MLRIGLKLWSTNTGPYLREARRLYAEGVFDYLELFVVPGSLDQLPCWREFDVPYVLHHAHSFAGFNPAVAEMFESNRRIADETREYAQALRPRFVIFHGGANGTVEEAARQLASFKKTHFSDQAMLIENKPYRPLPNKQGLEECRGATVGEIRHLMQTIGCGMCLDFGHAVAAANSQRRDPYGYIKDLNATFSPQMYHLSDVQDMTGEFDSHLHLGAGRLDIARLFREELREDAMVSIETVKDLPERLDDFREDVEWLRRFE